MAHPDRNRQVATIAAAMSFSRITLFGKLFLLNFSQRFILQAKASLKHALPLSIFSRFSQFLAL